MKQDNDIIKAEGIAVANNPNTSVPFIAYESMGNRQERTIRRLWILIIILILGYIGTGLFALHTLNQYELVDEYEVEIDTEGEGNANYIGEDGNIYNGTDSSYPEAEDSTS